MKYREADPQVTVERYEMFANTDWRSMAGFLQGEPGKLAPFAEAQTAVNGNYYIMGYTARIVSGKYVFWSPVLKGAGQDAGWNLGTSALNVDNILGYPQFG